jgi:hypothetical protein
MDIAKLTSELSAIDTSGTIAINYWVREWQVQLRSEMFLKMFTVYETELRKVGDQNRWFAHTYIDGVKFIAIVPEEAAI